MKVIRLIYEIKANTVKNIRLFSNIFVTNNKRKCKLIIDNKISPLEEIYKIKNSQIKTLKIKLAIIDGNALNFKCMFMDVLL